jgi:mono/diheme cytochrome c family protein
LGKDLYAASCSGCHGADPANGRSNISAAKTASNTLNAISNNKGGMGFLSTTIKATEAANIAAYVTKPF